MKIYYGSFISMILSLILITGTVAKAEIKIKEGEPLKVNTTREKKELVIAEDEKVEINKLLSQFTAYGYKHEFDRENYDNDYILSVMYSMILSELLVYEHVECEEKRYYKDRHTNEMVYGYVEVVPAQLIRDRAKSMLGINIVVRNTDFHIYDKSDDVIFIPPASGASHGKFANIDKCYQNTSEELYVEFTIYEDEYGNTGGNLYDSTYILPKNKWHEGYKVIPLKKGYAKLQVMQVGDKKSYSIIEYKINTVSEEVTDKVTLERIRSDIQDLIYTKEFDDFNTIEEANTADLLNATLYNRCKFECRYNDALYNGEHLPSIKSMYEEKQIDGYKWPCISVETVDRLVKELFGDKVKINHGIDKVLLGGIVWSDEYKLYMDRPTEATPTLETVVLDCSRLDDIYTVDISHFNYGEYRGLGYDEEEHPEYIVCDNKSTQYGVKTVYSSKQEKVGMVIYEALGKMQPTTSNIEYVNEVEVEGKTFNIHREDKPNGTMQKAYYIPGEDSSIYRYTLKLKEDFGVELISCRKVDGDYFY